MPRTVPFFAAVAGALTAASLAVAAPHQPAKAVAKQPAVPGFYESTTVRYYNFGPIELEPGNKLAPIWSVTNSAAGQDNIIDTVPGKAKKLPVSQAAA
jgi:hypothetical protein